MNHPARPARARRAATLTIGSVVALTLAVTGCGSRNEVTEAPAEQPSPSTPAGRFTLDGPGKKLTTDQAKAALLTRDDVTKNGWEVSPETKEPEETTEDASWYKKIKPQPCGDWWADFATGDAGPGQAETQGIVYTRSKPGNDDYAQITSRVATFDTPEQAETELKRQAKGQEVCPGFSLQSEKNSYNGSIKTIEGLHLGDQSTAWTLALKDNKAGGTYTTDTALVQFGHNLVKVSIWHHTDVEPDDLRKFIDANLERLDVATR